MRNCVIVPRTMSLTVRESSAFLFLFSVMVFPRSYLAFKLIMFAVFFIINIASLTKNKSILVHVRIIVFYYFIAGIGLIWAVVGFMNGGASVGIVDNLRLYVIWSVVLCIFFNLLLQGNAFLVFHKAIVTAGILISGMNYLALYSYVGQLGYIPDAVIKELHMFVGIHEGYIQITSHNIGALFFITAYLIAIQFRKDMSSLNGIIVKFSLLMCLALVALSGRRALWIAISMTPFLVILLTAISNGFNQLRGKKWLLLIAFVGFIPVIAVLDFALSGDYVDNSSLSHLQAAFSSSDERTIQKDYLIGGFKNYPILGSGFGVSAGYLRSEESPWLYELTYHQMLFNFGVVGITLFIFLIATYLYYAVAFIAQGNQYSGYAFSMLVAIIVFSIGAYSNPYFASFDFLLLLGVFPLIAASFYLEKDGSNIASSGGS